jgi:hypothetical protein
LPNGRDGIARLDEMIAPHGEESLLECTNCGVRGDFNYPGVKGELSFGAFWR